MKKMLLLVVALTVLTPWYALCDNESAEDATASIGKVVSLDGEAVAIGVDKEKRELSVKSEIFLNDTILTEDDSKLQIMFDDESIVAEPGREALADFVRHFDGED